MWTLNKQCSNALHAEHLFIQILNGVTQDVFPYYYTLIYVLTCQTQLRWKILFSYKNQISVWKSKPKKSIKILT